MMGRMLKGVRGFGRSAVMGGLTTGLLLAYLMLLPPHFVHHLFDEDLGRPACPLLAQSQHTPWLQADAPSLAPPVATDTIHALLPGVSVPARDLAVSPPRSPPRAAPCT
jgi:hypothetical protein